MSEELEWELFDIFESGLFVFPLYEHNSARKVMRYLLMRGILDEEIAEAIEDSTIDLHLWLNRCPGKYMVGEWVIAWMNDCREEYERERGDDYSDVYNQHQRSRELTPLSQTTTTDDPGDFADDISEEADDIRSDSRVTEFESISSQTQSADTVIYDSDMIRGPRTQDQPPPPLPPRSLMFQRIRDADGALPKERPAHRPSKLDLLKEAMAMCDNMYVDAPDSGNVSDIYTSIPPSKILGTYVKNHQDNCTLHPENQPVLDKHGLPVCENCTCTFTHYSYVSDSKNAKQPENFAKDDSETYIVDNQDYCNLYCKDCCMRAMEYAFDTLDKDGPGFIFIMTDSSHSSLSWSVEHTYKIASSRQPEKWLTEYRLRNIDVDLIWKVKVRYHLQASAEVHEKLNVFNVQSNWYRCKLSVIMDALSKTVRHYKL